MGSETEPEPSSTPRLPLFSIPPMPSPEPSGTLTPPLYTIASVPFRWEEEPGKPRPCTALAKLDSAAARCLELPPRLLTEVKITKMPSPTTVLEGPYLATNSKSMSLSSSFRFGSPEKGQLGTIVLSKRGQRGRGLLGSWGWGGRTLSVKGKRDVGRGIYAFSSSADSEDGGSESGSGDTTVKVTRIRRKGSFLSLSHAKSHFSWATIYEGLKQAIPWRSRKLKKDGLVI